MNINFTEEQAMLQQAARKFFDKEVPIELVRDLQESDSNGHSPALWKKTCQAGWLAIAIPEEYGGAGGTLLDLGIIYEESGRVLLPTSFYSTVHASLMMNELATEQQKQNYFEQIVIGGAICTVAFEEPQAFHDFNCFTTTAKKRNGHWILSGKKVFVQNAHIAKYVVVIAKTEDEFGVKGYGAFVVSPTNEGVTINEHVTFGKDRQFTVEFTGVVVDADRLLGNPIRTKEAVETARFKATVLQALEMVGGANKVIRDTVHYVSERKQFGVPIGSFQAVQHHLANMYTQADGARLIAYKAISLWSNGENAERETSIAKAFTSNAYKSISILAHQLWGGMGYATEANLFLYSNRAKATEVSFGNYDYHLRKIGNYDHQLKKIGVLLD